VNGGCVRNLVEVAGLAELPTDQLAFACMLGGRKDDTSSAITHRRHPEQSEDGQIIDGAGIAARRRSWANPLDGTPAAA
jgi:hypothetical protein